jgi:hypothetical protein
VGVIVLPSSHLPSFGDVLRYRRSQ